MACAKLLGEIIVTFEYTEHRLKFFSSSDKKKSLYFLLYYSSSLLE